MSFHFTNIAYQEEHGCVSWAGIQCKDSEQFSRFLTERVSERLDDLSEREEFNNHLKGLSLTGLGHENLLEVLAADQPEERSWAAGEALAESYLEEEEKVIFPWNMERDKRNPLGSLPGADIVGFIGEGSDCRFALGEVKTSSERRYPPQVMNRRSGHMGHQIDRLSEDLTVIYQLLKWLLPRVKRTEYEEKFNQASIAYFDSGKKDIVLFGILIRDTEENSLDLSGRGNALGRKLSEPTVCKLIALYLPWGIDQLINKIRDRGES